MKYIEVCVMKYFATANSSSPSTAILMRGFVSEKAWRNEVESGSSGKSESLRGRDNA